MAHQIQKNPFKVICLINASVSKTNIEKIVSAKLKSTACQKCYFGYLIFQRDFTRSPYHLKAKQVYQPGQEDDMKIMNDFVKKMLCHVWGVEMFTRRYERLLFLELDFGSKNNKSTDFELKF